MAPAADMARGERVMSESFYLSNMVPQVGERFNGSVWQQLEGDIRGWVKDHGKATIITGPVFESRDQGGERRVSYRVIGENRVAVPTHLYKIVLDNRDPASPRTLSFLLENRDYSSHESYTDEDHLASIDQIEELTGLDFLSELDDELEAAIEARRTGDIWLQQGGGG
jgi:endonuclease G